MWWLNYKPWQLWICTNPTWTFRCWMQPKQRSTAASWKGISLFLLWERKEGRKALQCMRGKAVGQTTGSNLLNLPLVTSNPKSSWQALNFWVAQLQQSAYQNKSGKPPSSMVHVEALGCEQLLIHPQHPAQWRELPATFSTWKWQGQLLDHKYIFTLICSPVVLKKKSVQPGFRRIQVTIHC